MSTDPSTASPAGPQAAPFALGPWRIEPETGRIVDGDTTTSLEPRVMALLVLLASAPGRVFSRETIEADLWPGSIVGEDTVARTVSRLRKALGDSAQTPRFVETLPRRGYRLVAPVDRSRKARTVRRPHPAMLAALGGLAMVTLALALILLPSGENPPVDDSDPHAAQVARADDLYMRFTRADNEAAIAIYERVLAAAPDNADAQAGFANALVQRVVRWPDRPGTGSGGASSLAEAFDRGLTGTAEAQAVLARAVAMAERAVRLSPRNPAALKALGFAYTAGGDLDRGEEIYEQVLAVDANAWAALINLGEIESMRGRTAAAIERFEEAYAAMGRAYAYEPQRVGPWQVALGVAIGERYEQQARPADAELWYRRVLAEAPFEPEATVRLARLLADSGDEAEARALCQSLRERVGDYPGCIDLQ